LHESAGAFLLSPIANETPAPFPNLDLTSSNSLNIKGKFLPFSCSKQFPFSHDSNFTFKSSGKLVLTFVLESSLNTLRFS